MELENIRIHKMVPVKVTLVNGNSKTLMVDSFMLAREVEQLLVNKLGLSLTSPFALYEADGTNTNSMFT